MTRQIAITGLGAVTPLGVGADTLVDRWLAGECAIDGGIAECREFDPRATLTAKEARRTDRFAQLGIAAAVEAVEYAGWDDELPAAAHRVGCIVGTGIGGCATHETQQDLLRERGPGRISPSTVPSIMPTAPAANLTRRYGILGYSSSVGSACAAGADAIALGWTLIQGGVLDAVLVGGTESCLTPLVIASFTEMGALSRCGLSRPFDRDRDGFVIGEGAGALALEAAEVAESRGATPIGWLRGVGMTSDAHHITAPHPTGAPAIRAMNDALERAGVSPGGISYVNAHGTSTPLNDPVETLILKEALGEAAWDVPVSSTKSVVGHTLGGAGAIDAVATTLALARRTAPPTVGLAAPDERCDLDYVPGIARRLGGGPNDALIGISNSFGFGGHNVVLVIEAGGSEPG